MSDHDLRIREIVGDPWRPATHAVRAAETPKETDMPGMTLAEALMTDEVQTMLRGLIADELTSDADLLEAVADAAREAVAEAAPARPMSAHQLQEAAREADPIGTEPAWAVRLRQLGGDPSAFGYKPPQAA
jgi:hypothetical protein